MSDQKTLPATYKRIQKAKKQGNTHKSPSLTALTSVTIGICSIYFYRTFILEYWDFLVKLASYSNSYSIEQSFKTHVLIGLIIAGFIITPYVISSIVVEIIQLGMVIQIGASFLSPRKIGAHAYFSLVLGNLKNNWLPFLTVGLLALFWYFFPPLYFPKALLIYALVVMWLAVIGDVLWRRFWWYRSLRMSIYDMREEHKESEGDPHTKAYRKSLHKAVSMQSLEERIKRAKVVVVSKNAGRNISHYSRDT